MVDKKPSGKQGIHRFDLLLIESAFDTARGILEHNRLVLERGARNLLDHETLCAAELATLGNSLEQEACPQLASVG